MSTQLLEDLQNFLDYTGLSIFYNKLKSFFASKTEVAEYVDAVDTLKDETDIYVTEVDYTLIAFDTTEIIDLEE